MAKKELVTLDGEAEIGFNVEQSVGFGGVNKIGDVMLTQAMLLYLVESGKDMFAVTGFKSAKELPEVTGKFDEMLGNAIKTYQAHTPKLLLKIDGIIHPASYAGRNIKYTGDSHAKRLMTITRLHKDLLIFASKNGNYTVGILRRFPQLGIWINE